MQFVFSGLSGPMSLTPFDVGFRTRATSLGILKNRDKVEPRPKREVEMT